MEGLESGQPVATGWPDIPTSLMPVDTGWLVLHTSLAALYQTLSIWLEIQFRQRYGHTAHRKHTIIMIFFGLAGP